MKDVHGSPIDDKTFNTSRDHLVLFRLPVIIHQVKPEFKIDTTAPFIPLRTRVSSLGARLMFRYYWLRDEKKPSTTSNSVQEADDSTSEEQNLHPPSSPIEESDSSEKSDVSPTDTATIFSQTAGRYEWSGKTNTGKRSRSSVRKGM
ncbi:hypothetical protein RMATCC62417_16293 [Rhizopus microsporus]|nr:hypothetical protein RMATCC62417_16293 [Rhizopus microsporus]